VVALAPRFPTGRKPTWSDRLAVPAMITLMAAFVTLVFTSVKARDDARAASATELKFAQLSRKCGIDPASAALAQSPFVWPWQSIVGAAFTTLSAFIGLVSAARRDSNTVIDRSPRDLQGCLYLLYDQIIQRKGLAQNDETRRAFRVTIHVIKGEEFEQVLDYVGGDGGGGGAGRKWPTTVGLVGLLLRLESTEPMVIAVPSDDPEAYINELVAKFGYARPEAKKLSPGRRASMVLPFTDDKGKVNACVYADSSDLNWFSKEIQELMVNGTEAIASFIRLRYSNP
jgi:hypothetical protein